ncbi:ion transporter [Marinicella meishanensis]|uniref:ion transporter n=1 Tax=Marinicella meishanensis TaxID=2873263 RepID=UPI001CBC75E9|nr:ion transporter [Marinicella sp. NBU2979]
MQDTLKRIHENKIFEWTVVSVIILSALLIGAKTYHLPRPFVIFLTYADIGITLFFLVEITIRFIASDDKRNFFKSGWNVFDTLIVVVSLIPIEDSEMALVGRLVRVFRVLRMVSIVPELRVLINSLIKAMPQLSYVMLLLFIIFYIYGAVGSFFFNEINPVLWGDIATSMLTLFRVMTFEDWTDVMYETMGTYPLSWAFYLSFIFFTAFAFLNMVIGIVVNVLEKENAAHERERLLENSENKLTQLDQIQIELKEIRALLKARQ